MSRPLAVALLVLALLAGCGSEDENGSADSETTTTATTTTTTPGAGSQSGDCTEIDPPAPKQNGGQMKPTETLELGKTYDVLMKTNCGEFTITLDQEAAPNTSASFVSLAKKGFFDDTTFHRIVPGFVIQGGDPTGSGSGGPGYKTVDKPPADAAYVKGVVAMAKTAAEAPGTSGSQFFVVTGEDIGLPPDYAIIGKVTNGLDVVEKIGTLGDPSEQPTQTVAIEEAKVTEK